MSLVVAAWGWLGTMAAESVVAAVVVGAVKGAIIGAVIGGVTSAMNGGDIGEGMLKGAVTGAVTGAIVGGFTYSGPTTTVDPTGGVDASQTVAADTAVGAEGAGEFLGETSQEVYTSADQLTQADKLSKVADVAPTTTEVATKADLAEALAKSTKEQAKITAWTEGGKALFTAYSESEAANEQASRDAKLLEAQVAATQANKISLEGFQGPTAQPSITGFHTRPVTSQAPGTPIGRTPVAQAVAPVAGVVASTPTAVGTPGNINKGGGVL